MEIKNFTITKRDGSKDQFSLDKIMNAIVSVIWISMMTSLWKISRTR